MAKPDTFKRSQSEVMHYILSFCMGRIYENPEAEYPRLQGGLTGFVSDRSPPEKGDLVLLSSAPRSKWTLGWLVDTREQSRGWPEYLIASLEDGALCWWGNVSVSHFHRPTLRKHPNWRWSDRQWGFQDRWFRVCYKEKDAYIVRPLMASFGEGFSVTLGTRTSHGFDDITPRRSFEDYRKVTKAMMAECYDECVAERERISAERKAAALPDHVGGVETGNEGGGRVP